MEESVPYRWSDRWRLAAEGSLDELQMLRDDVLQLGCEATIPWDETLAQTEIVARLAAARGEPADKLSLASVLLLRADLLAKVGDAELCCAHDFLNAGVQEGYERSLAKGEAAKARAASYEREAKELFPVVATGPDPEAAAILIAAISTRADGGDDEALGTLQRLMDAMPPENARAVKAAIRRMEQGITA